MNQQLDYEESLMNMGGFVLKEQRYKKIDDRPTSSKQPVGSRLKQAINTSGGRNNKAAATSHSFSGNSSKVLIDLNFIFGCHWQHHKLYFCDWFADMQLESSQLDIALAAS